MKLFLRFSTVHIVDSIGIEIIAGIAFLIRYLKIDIAKIYRRAR